jgi:hypothetical protein
MNNPRPQKGAAILMFVVLFLMASLSLVLTIGSGVYKDLARYRVLLEGKKSFYGAEAGIEDALYRHVQAESYSNTESFAFDGVAVSVTRTAAGSTFEFLSEGDMSGAARRSELVLAIGSGASFNFGLQSGNGGIIMENTSSVVGNVFSNGTVEGSGNMVYGDIISAGPSGLVEGVHATGSAWAHTIDNSTIDKNAYYQVKTATIVGGTSFPGSPDQATATMPISDAQIETWKGEALAGGVIAPTDPRCSGGTYLIDTDTTIGPVKIECNLIVDKNSTDLYLRGAVWVMGNIDIKNNANIRIDASIPGKSVAIVADNPSNRTSGSKIMLQNGSTFYGNGSNSFILLISQNNSSELGGSEYAITCQNSVSGKLLLYAAHGRAHIQNSASLKELTAHKIHLQNSAQIIYESGLVNLLFTSGPGGGYVITSWKETP